MKAIEIEASGTLEVLASEFSVTTQNSAEAYTIDAPAQSAKIDSSRISMNVSGTGSGAEQGALRRSFSGLPNVILNSVIESGGGEFGILSDSSSRFLGVLVFAGGGFGHTTGKAISTSAELDFENSKISCLDGCA